MAAWTAAELNAIGESDEMEVASSRSDGTLREAVTIWVVRAGEGLYVRGVRGTAGWFRLTQQTKQGHIAAGGVDKDVSFDEPDAAAEADIDAAYWAKYGRYPQEYVDSVLTPEAKAATIKLVPR